MTEVVPLTQAELDQAVKEFEDETLSQLDLVVAAFLAQQGAAIATPSGVVVLSGVVTLWTTSVSSVLVNILREIYTETALSVRNTIPDSEAEIEAARAIDYSQFEFFINQSIFRLSTIAESFITKASTSVQAGITARENTDQLRDRVTAALEEAVPHAGVIARSEAVAVANLASLTEMQLIQTRYRYRITKKWFDSNDDRVRHTHELADGKVVRINEPFVVGGFPIMYPGDPSGPPAIVRNCRCRLGYDVDATERTLTASDTDDDVLDGWLGEQELVGRMPPNLRRYWLYGPGALKIRWGTPGDFTRCVRNLREHVSDPQGTCANLHKDATGMWPGDRRNPGMSEEEFNTIEADDCGCEEETMADETECPPGQHKMPSGECMADEDMPAGTEEIVVSSDSGHWEGVLTVEGLESGDGRMFAENSLTWPEPNDVVLNLSWQPSSSPGHDNSFVVGRITEIWREGTDIKARGQFDVDGEYGSEAYRLVSSGMLRGVSVDVDSVRDADIEYIFPDADDENDEDQEVDEDPFSNIFSASPELTLFKRGRIRGATLVPIPAFVEAQINLVASAVENEDVAVEEASETFGAVQSHDTPTTDGPWDGDANVQRLPSPMSISTARNVYAWIANDAGDEVDKSDCKFPHHDVSAEGTPGSANLTACSAGIAALHGARGGTTIPSEDRQGVYDHLANHLRDGGKEPPPFEGESENMTSSAHVITIPSVPPAEWFSEPTDVDVHGALTVTNQGRVYGYLAPKGVAHRGFANKKVVVPMGNVDYSNFARGETFVEGGGRVPVGVITMNCGHMSPYESSDSEIRAEHYDNTCSVVAHISVGENSQGVWVAGALMPGVSPEQILKMMSCQLSGDWSPHREKKGMRELNAALLVPRPGFPFARTRASVEVSDGQLVASSVPVEFIRTEDCKPCAIKQEKKLTEKEELVATQRQLKLAQKELIMMRIGRDKKTRRQEIIDRIMGGK